MGGASNKPRFQGNWKCAGCGGDITSLPFEPDQSRLGQLKCSSCHSKGGAGASRGGDSFSKETHKGDWNCSKCGGEIKELRFKPDPERLDQLKCSACYIQGRPAR